MRIQNHLRKMGLARDALMALRRSSVSRSTSAPLFDCGPLDGRASDEALPGRGRNRLRAIIRSLPRCDWCARARRQRSGTMTLS